MKAPERCPLCGVNVVKSDIDFDTEITAISCARCGDFRLTPEFSLAVRDVDTIPLSCATRQASDKRRPIVLRTDNWERLSVEHSRTSIPQNVDKLLAWFAYMCHRPGQQIGVDNDKDYTVIDVRDKTEFSWYLTYVSQEGYASHYGMNYALTYRGWERMSGPITPGGRTGRCFVAMSFAAEYINIYEDGIKPAATQAGYEPILMRDIATNEDINFRILVEIRQAEILIADFTGQRGGVYFEAGYGLALGREVFWTCKQDELARIHFDANHFQCIDWISPDDLRIRLKEKIVAIKGLGPHRTNM